VAGWNGIFDPLTRRRQPKENNQVQQSTLTVFLCAGKVAGAGKPV
jgi:hypothetical protein